MAVVLFHISPHRLPGGYLGVDVFFVISGYLIIGFICRDIAKKTFSLSTFYARRIKRLFPALLATVIASSFGAYFLFLPKETALFAKSVLSTLLYISNMFFYTQSDYFDADLKFAPLLHTWSLSVEEQFYIIFPVLLLLISKYKPARLHISLILIGVASFILSEYLLHVEPSMSFFISPTRFWQFIVGGLLALNIHRFSISKMSSNLLGGIGLITLLICFISYNEETLFPGINALIPTIATLLILLAGNTSSPFSDVMANPINRFFGNISYSLYLWHWPIIVFVKLNPSSIAPQVVNIIILISSIILGYLSWKFIELPFSSKRFKTSNKVTFKTSIGVSAALISLMIYSTNGLTGRFDSEQLHYSSFLEYDRPGFNAGTCFLSTAHDDIRFFDKKQCINYDETKYNILLIGDSHAAHWNSALNQLAEPNQTISQVTSSGCRPIMPLTGSKRCVDLMAFGLNELVKSYRFDKIILSARWEETEFENLRSTVNHLTAFTDKLVVIGRTIEYKRDLPRLLATAGVDNIQNNVHYDYSFFSNMNEKFKKVVESNPRASYVSLTDIICVSEKEPVHCKTITFEDIPLAFDYGHFTHEGALEVAKQWKEEQF